MTLTAAHWSQATNDVVRLSLCQRWDSICLGWCAQNIYKYPFHILPSYNATRHEYIDKMEHRTEKTHRSTKENGQRQQSLSLLLCRLCVQSHCSFMKVGYFVHGLFSTAFANQMSKFIEKIHINLENRSICPSNWALYDQEISNEFHSIHTHTNLMHGIFFPVLCRS